MTSNIYESKLFYMTGADIKNRFVKKSKYTTMKRKYKNAAIEIKRLKKQLERLQTVSTISNPEFNPDFNPEFKMIDESKTDFGYPKLSKKEQTIVSYLQGRPSRTATVDEMLRDNVSLRTFANSDKYLYQTLDRMKNKKGVVLRTAKRTWKLLVPVIEEEPEYGSMNLSFESESESESE